MDTDSFGFAFRRRIARNRDERGVVTFGAPRRSGIGPKRHPDHLLPPGMAGRNAPSAALLAERDLARVDYAAGAGY